MIAVDANGADQGPSAVAEGVRRSGLPVLLFGPAAQLAGAGPQAGAASRYRIELFSVGEREHIDRIEKAGERSRRPPRKCEPAVEASASASSNVRHHTVKNLPV